ncbi:MULE transposase domain [Sesbania bispinosa]|nr:MULE transposase domain [Sesbania bispinosa]
MKVGDVSQMNNMLKVGIGAPQIFGSFANQSGGYEKVGFRKKDIYNQITQQRHLKHSDATAAVKYLRDKGLNDTAMFTQHTMTEDGRLEHLFWSDGIMQLNYKVFGDVLAFDATYGKNKYRLPLVVFSGLNHHNRTTIFASAVVANESEATYVWLLRQFLDAMKAFTAEFERCMLANYNVGKFQRKWKEMVTKFGVEEKPWVRGMYEKREMWAAA